jgi:hypothetical protein
MNHFFYETRSKEKVKQILDEGMRSQAYYRSGHPRPGLLSITPKVIFASLVIIGMLVLFIR